MLPAGFEPTVPENEQPQVYARDCTANGIGSGLQCWVQIFRSDTSVKCTVCPKAPGDFRGVSILEVPVRAIRQCIPPRKLAYHYFSGGVCGNRHESEWVCNVRYK